MFPLVNCLRFKRSGNSAEFGTSNITCMVCSLVVTYCVNAWSWTSPVPPVPDTWAKSTLVCPNPYVVLWLEPHVVSFQLITAQYISRLMNAQ